MNNIKKFFLISFLVTFVIVSIFIIFGYSKIKEHVEYRVIKKNSYNLAQSVEIFITKRYVNLIQFLLRKPDHNGDLLTRINKDLELLKKKYNINSINLYDAEFNDMFNSKNKGKLSKEMRGIIRLNDPPHISVNDGSVIVFLPFDKKHKYNISEDPAFFVFLEYEAPKLWPNYYRVLMLTELFAFFFLALLFFIIYRISFDAEDVNIKQIEKNYDLIKEKKEAEMESKAKTGFLANVSHELRTPLNSIIGFSEIIKDEVKGPLNNKEYKSYVSDIHAAGKHLLSLINDILDYSKTDANKLEVKISDIDITKIINNCVRLMKPKAEEGGLVIKNEMPVNHFIVHADPKRVKQVILNVMSNAIKNTEAGGSLTVFAYQQIAQKTLTIEFIDNGIGIAEKDLAKVFSEFGQVESELSGKHQGTGLGLPLSKKLIELMKGDLILESKVGEGTAVKIILPVGKQNPSF